MLVFSLAGAPLSVSHNATRAVNLLYCRSPRVYLQSAKIKSQHFGVSLKFLVGNGNYC